MEIPKRDITTDLGLLLIVLIWGVNFSVLKVLLLELDPLALNALRFPMAAIALWILVRRLDGVSKPHPEDFVVSSPLVSWVMLRTNSASFLGSTRLLPESEPTAGYDSSLDTLPLKRGWT
ncbi:MAG: hypothetical protein Ct9H300mP15_17950 [Gemmatimonadota bacterium]|nr:MAG: hypothetical protein Ct9H300mP15_17950 [Gemmatimonadota bacterium]